VGQENAAASRLLAAMRKLVDGCCTHHLDELLLDTPDKGKVKERAQA
jgi:hypothetical protein